MKIVLLLAITMMAKNSYSEIPPQQLRSWYYDASQSSAAADKFYSKMKAADSTSALQIGYKAMSEFMKSYHSFNPVNKLSYFTRGKSNLDKAISLEPENIELRYLRFTVQTNIPFFLNYTSSLNDDKQFLMKSFAMVKDEQLKQMIREYMQSCDECSAEEKKVFQ